MRTNKLFRASRARLRYLCVLIVLCSGYETVAQIKTGSDSAASVSSKYYYEPFPQKVGESIFQLGASFILLPTPDAEEYPMPFLDVQVKYGLLKYVSLVSTLSTNYFTSLFQLGFQVNDNISRFSYGFANHVGGFIGTYHLEMFEKTFAYSISYSPLLRLGFRADKFSTSVSLRASYTIQSGNKVAALYASGPAGRWNDYNVTLAIEQYMLRKTSISIGLSMEYTRSPFEAWFFYDTIEEYQV